LIYVGWLLALSVALVNTGSGLMALYILLACVGSAFLTDVIGIQDIFGKLRPIYAL
jgi:Kef-type K+ transport system membrane component KefB